MLFGRGDKGGAKKSDRVNGLLDCGCVFEGKLNFEGTVQINGDFKGEVYSDGTLVVGNEGCVNAKIKADTVVIFGKVQGEIEAKSKIEMRMPAVVIANIKTHTLCIDDGVVFHGNSKMEHDEVAQELKVTPIGSAKKDEELIPDEAVM